MSNTDPILLSTGNDHFFNLFLNGAPLMKVCCSEQCARWHLDNLSWTHPEFRWLYHTDRISMAPQGVASQELFDDFAFAS